MNLTQRHLIHYFKDSSWVSLNVRRKLQITPKI